MAIPFPLGSREPANFLRPSLDKHRSDRRQGVTGPHYVIHEQHDLAGYILACTIGTGVLSATD